MFGISLSPQPPKLIETLAGTFGARAMTRRKSDRFIQKKQLGIVAGRHNRAPSSLELQHTDDPPFALKGPPDLAVLVVQTASVAHESAARRSGNYITKGCYPVLV